MAPNDKPTATHKTPIHFPKIKPAKIATGVPKPAANVQITVNRINNNAKINKLDSFKAKK